MAEDLGTQTEVHQRWLMQRLPAAEELVPFVQAVEATAQLPVDRFSAWAQPSRELKGSRLKARDKLLSALASGYRGERIETVGVYSYNHRGSNFMVGTQLWFTPNHDEVTGLFVTDAPVKLEVARSMAPATDAEGPADALDAAAQYHPADARRDGEAMVRDNPLVTFPEKRTSLKRSCLAGPTQHSGTWAACPRTERCVGGSAVSPAALGTCRAQRCSPACTP